MNITVQAIARVMSSLGYEPSTKVVIDTINKVFNENEEGNHLNEECLDWKLRMNNDYVRQMTDHIIDNYDSKYDCNETERYGIKHKMTKFMAKYRPLAKLDIKSKGDLVNGYIREESTIFKIKVPADIGKMCLEFYKAEEVKLKNCRTNPDENTFSIDGVYMI